MKQSYYTKLENIVNNWEKSRSTKLYLALKDILNSNFARTGHSGYSKGWANKSIWTPDVSIYLRQNGFPVKCGNDARRGGACGEWVKIDSPAFDKAIIAAKKADEEKRDIAAKIYAEKIESLKKEITMKIISEKHAILAKCPLSEIKRRISGDKSASDICNKAVMIIGTKYVNPIGWIDILELIYENLK